MRRGTAKWIFVTMAAVLGVASVAWACTPSAYITASVGEVQMGDQVTITGYGFTEGAVEARWDSSGGPLLGSAVPDKANKGRIDLSVTIPTTEPGIHSLFAVHRATDGQTYKPLVRFNVAPAAPVQPSDEAQAVNTEPAPNPAPLSETPPVPQAAVSDQPATAPVAPSTAAAPAPRTSAARASASAPALRAPLPADEPVAATGTVTPTAVPAAAPGSGLAPIASSSSDLWSGFSANPGSAGAGLNSDGATATTSSGSGGMIGVVLLVAGLGGLLAGTAVVVTGRRKVRATGDASY